MKQNKYKILLVKDELNIRNLVTTVLENAGYSVDYEKAAVAASGDKVTDGVSTYVAGNQKGQNVTNGAYAYYNAKMAEDLNISDAVQYSTTELEKLPTENNTLKAVSKGEVLTIEVKVWIEGWDAECLNAIFAQTLSVAFSFKYEETL